MHLEIFNLVLLLATLLCSLNTGLLIAFTVLIMPALKTLNAHEYLGMFKAIDKIIQNNHPVFMIVWVGSFLSLLVCAVWGYSKLQGLNYYLVLASFGMYLLLVQVPTVVLNIPLNNELQAMNLENASDQELNAFLQKFKARWLPSNTFRTFTALGTSVMLLFVVFNR